MCDVHYPFFAREALQIVMCLPGLLIPAAPALACRDIFVTRRLSRNWADCFVSDKAYRRPPSHPRCRGPRCRSLASMKIIAQARSLGAFSLLNGFSGLISEGIAACESFFLAYLDNAHLPPTSASLTVREDPFTELSHKWILFRRDFIFVC